MRILVVGSGVAGLGALRALDQHGIEAEIVERSTGFRPEGTGFYLPGNGMRALARLGAEAAVLDTGKVITWQRVCDSSGVLLGEASLEELWGDIGPCCAFPRWELHAALLGVVDGARLTYPVQPHRRAVLGLGVKSEVDHVPCKKRECILELSPAQARTHTEVSASAECQRRIQTPCRRDVEHIWLRVIPALMIRGESPKRTHTAPAARCAPTAARGFRASPGATGRRRSVRTLSPGLRSRRWLSPDRLRRFLDRELWRGPSITPNSSTICTPGKVAVGVRMKNSTASRSRTAKPNGAAAGQDSARRFAMARWNADPRSVPSAGLMGGRSRSVTKVKMASSRLPPQGAEFRERSDRETPRSDGSPLRRRPEARARRSHQRRPVAEFR